MTVKVFCLPLATFSPLGAKATMNSPEHVGSDQEVRRTNPLSAQPQLRRPGPARSASALRPRSSPPAPASADPMTHSQATRRVRGRTEGARSPSRPWRSRAQGSLGRDPLNTLPRPRRRAHPRAAAPASPQRRRCHVAGCRVTFCRRGPMASSPVASSPSALGLGKAGPGGGAEASKGL